MSLAALPFFKKPKGARVTSIPQRVDSAQEPADVQLGAETPDDLARKKKGKRRFQRALTTASSAPKKSGLNTGK